MSWMKKMVEVEGKVEQMDVGYRWQKDGKQKEGVVRNSVKTWYIPMTTIWPEEVWKEDQEIEYIWNRSRSSNSSRQKVAAVNHRAIKTAKRQPNLWSIVFYPISLSLLPPPRLPATLPSSPPFSFIFFLFIYFCFLFFLCFVQ